MMYSLALGSIILGLIATSLYVLIDMDRINRAVCQETKPSLGSIIGISLCFLTSFSSIIWLYW